MKARVHLPDGSSMVINTTAAEVRRLSELKDHRVEVLPDRDVFSAGASWLSTDLRQPRGKA